MPFYVQRFSSANTKMPYMYDFSTLDVM